MSLAIFPRQLLVDRNGRPRVGAKAYFYEADSSTPITLYKSPDFDVEHENPVISVEGGLFPGIYVNAAEHPFVKIRITDANDIEIMSDPKVPMLGASEVGRTNAEILAFVVPVDLEKRERDPLRYCENTVPGTTDMSPGFDAAIAVCQALGNRSVLLSPGHYAIEETVVVTGANAGIQFVAEKASRQNGSVKPATLIDWTGGAAHMFELSTSFVGFHNVAFRNRGTGTSCFKTTVAGGRIELDDFSFVTNDNPWSVSVIDALENGTVNYSVISNGEMSSPAPFFLTYDGMNPPSANTTIEFRNITMDCDGADFTFMKVKDGGFDRIVMHDITANTQTAHEFCLFDSDEIGIPGNIIQTLELRNIEYDNAATPAAGRMLKLKNVRSANVDNLQVIGGGNITGLIDLTNSTLFVGRVYGSAIGGPLAKCLDTFSQVFALPCPLNLSNTAGITRETAGICGQVDIAYAASMSVLLHLGLPSGHTVYKIHATNNTAFAIELPDHLASAPNATFRTRGQIFTVRIRNGLTTGNALGAITFGAAFTLKGSVIGPDAGREMSLTFVWDGTTAYEIARNDRESGSVTLTLTGCTTTPTQTAHYSRVDDNCFLSIDNSLTGVSNSASKTLTNTLLPVSMRPARQQVCVARTYDNGAATVVGCAVIETTGVITLGKDLSAGGGGFTQPGVAGIGGPCVLSWVRN